MIKRVRIRNFGSLCDIDVILEPLTVLIGANASGKSMFIRALRTLSMLLRTPLRSREGREFEIDHATLDELVSKGDASRRISFEVWLEDPAAASPTYFVELGKVEGLWCVTREHTSRAGFSFRSDDGPIRFNTESRGEISWGSAGAPPRHALLPFLLFPHRDDRLAATSVRPFLELRAALGLVYGYRVSPSDLVNPNVRVRVIDDSRSRSSTRQRAPQVDVTGARFPHRLQWWKQTVAGSREFSSHVVPKLRELFPHIVDVGLRGSYPEVFIEYQTTRSATAVPAQLESDGVNFALFLAAIPYVAAPEPSTTQASTGETLCLAFEEPEAGTHPALRRKRLDLLRKLAAGDITGSPVQVIITTHAKELVRGLSDREAIDVVRLATHVGANGTEIRRIASAPDVWKFFENPDFDPGS